MKKQECPICEEIIHVAMDLSEEGVRYECPNCGQFSMADASALSIHRYKSALRRSLLASAARRAAPGALPFIHGID